MDPFMIIVCPITKIQWKGFVFKCFPKDSNISLLTEEVEDRKTVIHSLNTNDVGVLPNSETSTNEQGKILCKTCLISIDPYVRKLECKA